MKTTILVTISIAAMLAFTARAQAAGHAGGSGMGAGGPSPGGGGAGVGGPSAGGNGAGVGGPSAGGGNAGVGGPSQGGGNAGVGGPSAGGGFGGAGSPAGASPANPPAGTTILTPNNQATTGLGANNVGVNSNNLALSNSVGLVSVSNQFENLTPTGSTNGTVAIPEQGPTPLPEF
jgi:DNA polymerase-3 subunit gamma/tau